MSVVAIVYFSGYGHTAKQAEAVADGVRSAGATARVYRLTTRTFSETARSAKCQEPTCTSVRP
jgi:NAD(P)H dehydrogenase (quinone)